MKKNYKVDFLPSVIKTGATALTRYEKPLEGLDIANNLEALLLERDQEGLALLQIMDYERSNPLTGKNLSGLLVVFKKE